jgi:hypothetical protein
MPRGLLSLLSSPPNHQFLPPLRLKLPFLPSQMLKELASTELSRYGSKILFVSLEGACQPVLTFGVRTTIKLLEIQICNGSPVRESFCPITSLLPTLLSREYWKHNFGGFFNTIPVNVSTVVDLLDTKGISWGEYQENLPYAGFQGFNYSNQISFNNSYVRKHNPLIIYDSVASNATRLSLIKNFTSFNSDLAAQTLPQCRSSANKSLASLSI